MIKINTETEQQEIGNIAHHSWNINPKGLPYATCGVNLYSPEGGYLKSFNLAFTKEELDPWGEDDSILDTIVLNKLGFTKFEGEE